MTAVFQQAEYDEGQEATGPTAAWASSGACNRCFCGGEGSTQRLTFEAYMRRFLDLSGALRFLLGQHSQCSAAALAEPASRSESWTPDSTRCTSRRRFHPSGFSATRFPDLLNSGSLWRDPHSLHAVQVPAEPALIAAVRSGDEESARGRDRHKLCGKIRSSSTEEKQESSD